MSNIFAPYARPVRSVAEYSADMDAAEQNKLVLAAERMKAQQNQAAMEEDQALRRDYARSGGDQNVLRRLLTERGAFPAIRALDESDLKQRKANADIGSVEAQTRETAAKTIDKSLTNAKQFVPGISTPQQAQAWVQGLYSDPVLGPLAQRLMPIEQSMQQIPQDEAGLMRWKAGHMNLTGDKLIDLLTPKTDSTNLGGVQSFGATDRFTGQRVETGSTPITQSADNAATNARIVSEGAANRGVQVRGQNLVNQRAIDAERNRPAPTEGKPMTAQQEAKYRTQIAKDYQAANTNLANFDEVIDSINAVRTAPGLGGATGLQSYIPSMPNSKAAQAEVALKNLEGKITKLGKAAAAQGGAVGPMAVQEWKIVRDMIAAIEPQKGDKALLDQLDLVESASNGAAARIRDAYEKHYGQDFERYPQFQDLAESKPKGVDKGKPVQVKSDADYNALPSGSVFVGPDGKTRRKP